MERKQKGEQFRIIDYARLSEKPISPNMKFLFVVVIAAGLGIGGGVVFLLDFLNTAFKSPEDIESVLGVPVLVTVPTVTQHADRMWRRLNSVMSVCVVMLSIGLMAVFGVLAFKGVDVTIEFIRRFVNI